MPIAAADRQRPVYIYVIIPFAELTREMVTYCRMDMGNVRRTVSGPDLVLLKYVIPHNMFRPYTKYTHREILEILDAPEWAGTDTPEDIMDPETVWELLQRYNITDYNTLSGVIDQNFDLPIATLGRP